MYLGPTFALTQSIARPHMRALASAVLLFIINLVGLGLGPSALGALSDALAPRFGGESLRYAMIGVSDSPPVLGLAVCTGATLLVSTTGRSRRSRAPWRSR